MTENVTVGFCHPGEVSGTFLESMLDLTVGHTIGGYIANETGPRLATARNVIVEAFLKHRDTPWLLMVDTDMSFTRSDVEQLVASADEKERPIVGGLCFSYGKTEIRPTLYVTTPEKPYEPVWNYPSDAICEVDATGAAFLLLHRSVLTAMGDHFEGVSAYKWFADSEINLEEIGEDVTFCLRARALGFPVHVNTGVKIGHRKARMVTEDLYRSWRVAWSDANQ